MISYDAHANQAGAGTSWQGVVTARRYEARQMQARHHQREGLLEVGLADAASGRCVFTAESLIALGKIGGTDVRARGRG